MKKQIISLFIAFVMVLGCVPMTVSAQAADERDINDYLTIHYDFDNCTYYDSGAVKTVVDIAPVGDSEDTLTFTAGAGNDGKLTGGDGTVKNTATSINSLGLTTEAGKADVKATTGEGTFYMRFKLNENTLTSLKTYLFFIVTDKNQITLTKDYPSMAFYRTDTVWASVSMTSTLARKINTFDSLDNILPTSATYDADAWVNLFVTFSENGSGNLVRTTYMSVGDNEEPVIIETQDLGASSLKDNGDNTVLRLFGTNIQRTDGLEIDDFRYYNTDLSEDEFCKIFETGSFSGIDASRDINDHLTIHYDFNNCTYSETDDTAVRTVSDVAPVGDSEDTLTFTAGAGNDGKLTGGDGTVKNTATATNALGLATEAGKADVKAMTGEGTFYVRFKFNENTLTSLKTYLLFTVTSTENITDTKAYPSMLFYRTSDTWASVSMTSAEQRKIITDLRLDEALPTSETYNAEEWVNLFVTLSKNDSGNLVRTTYMSIGDDDTPVIIETVDLEASSLKDNGDTTVLRLFGTNIARTDGLEIDDFRYYNTDLAEDEFCKIFETGSFSGIDASVENIRYQIGTTTYMDKNGTSVRDVRLIAEINADNYQSFTKAGFTVKATGTGINGKKLDFDTAVCYESLLARDGDGNIVKVDATTGKYFIAVVLNGIPTSVTDLEISTSAYVETTTTMFRTSTVTITGIN